MQEYLLLIDNVEFNRIKLKKELSDISGFTILQLEGIYGAGAKGFVWDNSMQDMKKLSELYPTRVMTLQYIGDKVSETYREYYLNGKVQVVPVRMSFDEFNEKFLA